MSAAHPELPVTVKAGLNKDTYLALTTTILLA